MKYTLVFFLLFWIIHPAFAQDITVHFEFDNSHINRDELYRIKSIIKKHDPSHIVLKGYADTIGRADYNKKLSQARLLSVKKVINNVRKGIDIDMINHGEHKSFAHGRQYRKVEISLSHTTTGTNEAKYRHPQVFNINNDRDTLITCAQGTKILIFRETFVIKDTNIKPDGPIQLRVAEYYEPADMIYANLTTESGNEVLQTGGMLWLDAMYHDDECIIEVRQKIGIQFPGVTEEDSMQLYTGEKQNGNLDWVLMDDANQSIRPVEIFTKVERMPEFLSEDSKSFISFLQSKLRYPAIARENGIEGEVLLSFLVNEEGLIKNPRINNSIHPSIDHEILRVLALSPPWIPGRQREQPVPVLLEFPLNFDLDDKTIPTDPNNRILTEPDFASFTQKDSILDKYAKTLESLNEFYLFTDKLQWINCDKIYRMKNKGKVKIQAEKDEDYYAVFNDNKSIIRPRTYLEDEKVIVFDNLPRNENIMIIGMKVDDDKTYTSITRTKTGSTIIVPKYEQMDKDQLKERLEEMINVSTR